MQIWSRSERINPSYVAWTSIYQLYRFSDRMLYMDRLLLAPGKLCLSIRGLEKTVPRIPYMIAYKQNDNYRSTYVPLLRGVLSDSSL